MKQSDPEILFELSQQLEIDLHEKRSIEDLKQALVVYINHLISNDYNKLMRILYKVDVSEKLLKTNLQQQQKDAVSIIAEMIIERQIEKMRSRQQFKTGNKDDIPENEKW